MVKRTKDEGADIIDFPINRYEGMSLAQIAYTMGSDAALRGVTVPSDDPQFITYFTVYHPTTEVEQIALTHLWGFGNTGESMNLPGL